ncbi:MAG TPA: hypothetical protein EYP98_20755, partial [Planctomycetes bacterium]|nr:hypothetical protein [Planctomycetota bacterium]
LAGVDVVIDGSDNFPTRFLANDLCVEAGPLDERLCDGGQPLVLLGQLGELVDDTRDCHLHDHGP